MRKYLLIYACLAGLAVLLIPHHAHAQASVESILPLDAHITQDGRSIELNWFDADPPRVGSVTVKRRIYGRTGGQSWTELTSGLGPVVRYTDATIQPGTAYEYQVQRLGRDIIDVGYWLAGTEIPAQAQRGTAYIVVDASIAQDIAPRLARFARDLAGDGWAIEAHQVPRNLDEDRLENLKNAVALRDLLRARYNSDPFGQHAVILVGRVPVVKSGQINPDGHGARPHPTDLFYADVDGRWGLLRSGDLQNSQVPGDFVELQVGRIDFAPVSGGDRETEIRLLRAYFDKNHHWRMGYLGDLKEAYGATGHLAVERAGLRNIVGAQNVTEGGHHTVGEEHPWLWGVDFGDWDGSRYAADFRNKSVFALNFGSHKQMFDQRSNAMTALLAQPWYPVAVGWGGRPAWWLHHMALGGTIGDVHMRTVNNGRASEPYRDSLDYFPTGAYLMRNGIWVNLLGDPTLRAFPLRAPGRVTTTPVSDGIQVSWQASDDPDTLGYHLFRAIPDQAGFKQITGTDPVSGTVFTDSAPVDGARYMVRAYGLKKVYAGSFFTFSQGAFSTTSSELIADIALTAPAGSAIALPQTFSSVTDGVIRAFIEDPPHGQLNMTDTGWVYQPRTGFTGQVPLRISVSDGWRSATGQLVVTISP